MEEVRSFARRRPGAFLALCAVVGLVGGRVTRGLRDEGHQDQTPSGTGQAPAVPAVVEPTVQTAPVPSYGGRPSAGVPGSPVPSVEGGGRP
ncbi:MAG: hypothetical protein DCC50_10555 [Acidobacteria bacterium]|nr:MAG: hypothetical protein DCC50_10555 [Acidobacteriota bacterium]